MSNENTIGQPPIKGCEICERTKTALLSDGLTDEEIDTVYLQHWQLARAIEAKLKEKNT